MNAFKDWLRARQNNGLIGGSHFFKTFEEMSKGDLNSQLEYFVFEVRKSNGKKYPASSLRDLFQGIGYYITTILKRDWRIFNDSEFVGARKALNAAMIETNKEKVEASGRGPAEAISKEQEEKLWNGGLLGNDSPRKLLRTLFFLVGKFFGLRGGPRTERFGMG